MFNEIFGEVELTKGEIRRLVWLAGREESTVANVMSAIRKAIATEARRLAAYSVHRTDKLPSGRKRQLLIDGTAVESVFELLSTKVTKLCAVSGTDYP